MSESRITAKRAASHATDEETAVAEVRRALGDGPLACVVLFCSPSYDLVRLGAALRRTFQAPVLACTSAGQLGPEGYQKGGLTAVGLSSTELQVRTHVIHSLAACHDRAVALAETISREVAAEPAGTRAFGLVLVDGLALAEEHLAAALHEGLDDVPLIGGSAGDDLAFTATHVYVDGAFVQDAAMLAIFVTTLPFVTFKFQQVEATRNRLVVTAADPDKRIIHEINGMPAALAYAELVGVPVGELDAAVFSQNPLVYSVHGEPYVRSIARVNADLSMTMFCAIQVGLVLSIGAAIDAVETVERAFAEVHAEVGEPAVVIGCDCILRRLDLERQGIDDKVGALLAHHGVVGFSTYGEQWNAVHVNQTFTGVAIGA